MTAGQFEVREGRGALRIRGESERENQIERPEWVWIRGEEEAAEEINGDNRGGSEDEEQRGET